MIIGAGGQARLVLADRMLAFSFGPMLRQVDDPKFGLDRGWTPALFLENVERGAQFHPREPVPTPTAAR